MGTSFIMICLVVLSGLVAAVCAEADPQLGYGYGVGLKSAPCVNAYNHPVPCNGYHGVYGAGVYGAGVYGKRDADAQIGYGIGLKNAPCVNAYNHPVPCNGVHGVYGAGVYGKRDADAQILGGAGIYGAGVYRGYAHAVAATPYGLTHSSNVGLCHNFVGAQVPC